MSRKQFLAFSAISLMIWLCCYLGIVVGMFLLIKKMLERNSLSESKRK